MARTLRSARRLHSTNKAVAFYGLSAFLPVKACTNKSKADRSFAVISLIMGRFIQRSQGRPQEITLLQPVRMSLASPDSKFGKFTSLRPQASDLRAQALTGTYGTCLCLTQKQLEGVLIDCLGRSLMSSCP